MWKLKSEWWPPSLLSSLTCFFCKLVVIVSSDGNSIMILQQRNEKKSVFLNICSPLDRSSIGCIALLYILWTLHFWSFVIFRNVLVRQNVAYVHLLHIVRFLCGCNKWKKMSNFCGGWKVSDNRVAVRGAHIPKSKRRFCLRQFRIFPSNGTLLWLVKNRKIANLVKRCVSTMALYQTCVLVEDLYKGTYNEWNNSQYLFHSRRALGVWACASAPTERTWAESLSMTSPVSLYIYLIYVFVVYHYLQSLRPWCEMDFCWAPGSSGRLSRYRTLLRTVQALYYECAEKK